jgi:hypothetical protein
MPGRRLLDEAYARTSGHYSYSKLILQDVYASEVARNKAIIAQKGGQLQTLIQANKTKVVPTWSRESHNNPEQPNNSKQTQMHDMTIKSQKVRVD